MFLWDTVSQQTPFPSDSYSLLILKLSLSLRHRAWVVDASAGAGHNCTLVDGGFHLLQREGSLMGGVIFIFYDECFPSMCDWHHMNDGSL